MKPKTLVTVVLAVFVVASVAFAVAKQTERTSEAEATVETPAQFVVFYFHGAKRCHTCMSMEAYAREAVEADFAAAIKEGSLEWRTVDFSQPENEALAKAYGVSFSSVAVAQLADGKTVRFKVLDQLWDLVSDRNAFMAYVSTEVEAFMGQR